jgi:hypothetical protein
MVGVAADQLLTLPEIDGEAGNLSLQVKQGNGSPT